MIDRATYDRLLALARENPSTYHLRTRGRVSHKTAERALRRGWPDRGWPPLNDVLAAERESARARAEAARGAASATENASRVQAAELALVEEARKDVQASLLLVGHLLGECGASLKRFPIRLDALPQTERIRVVTSLTRAARAAVTAADRCAVLERRVAGEPTEVHEHRFLEATEEQVLEEVAPYVGIDGVANLRAALRGELRVVEGGRKAG